MRAGIDIDVHHIVVKMAIACCLVSFVWPLPETDQYRPSLLLLFKGIAALPFAIVGFMYDDVMGAAIRVAKILFGVVLPNWLMFVYLYKRCRRKPFHPILWLVYLTATIFVFAAITLPALYEFHHRYHALSLNYVRQSGGVLLWNVALGMMTFTLWKARKQVLQSD